MLAVLKPGALSLIAAGCRACASLIAVFSELTPIAERLRSANLSKNGRMFLSHIRSCEWLRRGRTSPSLSQFCPTGADSNHRHSPSANAVRGSEEGRDCTEDRPTDSQSTSAALTGILKYSFQSSPRFSEGGEIAKQPQEPTQFLGPCSGCLQIADRETTRR